MAKSNRLGSWAFLIGVILAVILGVMSAYGATAAMGPGMLWVLIIIGLIVGLLNVSEHEVNNFLMSGAILVIVSAFGAGLLSTITLVSEILNALMVIFVPATIVVAIKHVFGMARH